MSPMLRVPADPGYLSNKRMALEIAVGLAHLTGRDLCLPVDEPIGWGPRPARGAAESGPPASLRDLYELPVPVVGPEEDPWCDRPAHRPDWPEAHLAVVVDPPPPDDDEDVAAFAAGRRIVTLDPAWDDEPVVELTRTLAHYSSWFHLAGDRRRTLFDLLERIRPRAPYRELGRAVAEDLGRFNAAHIRRTDMLVGVQDYRRVTPWDLRDTLAEVFDAATPLVVCTEADPGSDVFVPLRAHFAEVVFLNDHVLTTAGGGLDALPRHDDTALALVSQEVATRAAGFAGTLGSTFTGIIHRQRRLADATAPFWFTADFLGAGDGFRSGEYLETRPGPYSWNRLECPLEPGTIAWFREWPEVLPPPA